jgi:predicted enzyme related to lactoylglutathione lyase
MGFDARATTSQGVGTGSTFVVDNIAAKVARLRDAGTTFRNDIVTGPGGQQIFLEDPSGNRTCSDQTAPRRVHAAP